MKNTPTGSFALIFMGMLYVAIFISSVLVINKQVSLFGLTASLASFVVPFGFTISDMITEVYGYGITRKIIWGGLVVQGIFCIALSLLIKLHSPITWHNQLSYDYIFGPLPKIFFSGIVAVPIAIFFNSFLISKSKIMFQGRFFWLRSIAASIAGEILYTIICASIIFIGNVSFEILLQLIISSIILKLLFSTLLSMPASIVVSYLEEIEQLDIYDDSTSFNPFKLETPEN